MTLRDANGNESLVTYVYTVREIDESDVNAFYQSLALKYKSYYDTMKTVVDGSVTSSDTNYIYLVNKLTAEKTKVFTESELSTLLGESLPEYTLETAKGGFGYDVTAAKLKEYRVAEKNLKSFLTELRKHVSSLGKCPAARFQPEIDYEIKYSKYYDFFNLTNSATDQNPEKFSYTVYSIGADGKETSTTETLAKDAYIYDTYVDLYIPWRNAKIYEEYFYRMYMKYLTYGSMIKYNGEWVPDFKVPYSCIVVGVAENFGKDDLSVDSIKPLKAYAENDGNFFIFHQTINDSGSTTNMTRELKTIFGQNYNHTTSETREITETKFNYYVSTQNTAGSAQYNKVNEDGTHIGMTGTYDINADGMDITATYQYGNLQSLSIVKNTSRKITFSWSNRGYAGAEAFDNLPNPLYICLDYNNTGVITIQPSSTAASGSTELSSSARARTYTGTVNITDGDTNKYHYTPLLSNGGTIALSSEHLTMVNKGSNGNAEKFAKFNFTQSGCLWTDIEVPNLHIADNSDSFVTKVFTDKASQTNQGVVTMYPFMIKSELKISGTHPNTYSTDIEDDDMVVYYTLAGGTPGSQSSAAAADPHDGIDNYFIYSYNNVTYCGAGHTLVTGFRRDNNDERRLFINIILNTVKKSIFGPTIEIYDPYPETDAQGNVKTDENGNPKYINSKITKGTDGSYEMVVPNTSAVPEFTYRVTVPDRDDDVAEVKIYYDLSPNSSGDKFGYSEGTDALVFHALSDKDGSILKNLYKLISEAVAFKIDPAIATKCHITDLNTSALKLDEEFFRPYDYKYTYLVVAVRTRKNVYTQQRIMIKVAPKLWDLT